MKHNRNEDKLTRFIDIICNYAYYVFIHMVQCQNIPESNHSVDLGFLLLLAGHSVWQSLIEVGLQYFQSYLLLIIPTNCDTEKRKKQ